jgi:hypothetical protein
VGESTLQVAIPMLEDIQLMNEAELDHEISRLVELIQNSTFASGLNSNRMALRLISHQWSSRTWC